MVPGARTSREGRFAQAPQGAAIPTVAPVGAGQTGEPGGDAIADPTVRGKRGRWPWVVAAALVALGGAVVVAGLLLRDTTTPVPLTQAVQSFRDEADPDLVPDVASTSDADSESPDNPSGPDPEPSAPIARSLPAPGVYLYETSGFEAVDALGGARHEYPAATTVTVRAGDCGALHRWDALEERFEEWETCWQDGELVMPWYTAFHRFFGNDDRQEFRCDRPVTLIPVDPAPGVSATGTCRSGGLVETLTVEVIATDALAVAESAVDAVHIMIAISLEGDSVGRFAGEMWLGVSDGLLLRWTESGGSATGSPVGDVHYDEELDLVLSELVPRR